MAKVDDVRALIEPIVAAEGADLYDVVLDAGRLLVAVTRPGGIDLDAITDIAREVNAVLDAEDPINGSYTLEVSSPGLERTLRTPAHFAGAIGCDVTMRTKPGGEGDRRVKGVIVAADATTVTVRLDPADGTADNAVEGAADDAGAERIIPLDDIERARTIFSWEPAPKPGKSRSHKEAR